MSSLKLAAILTFALTASAFAAEPAPPAKPAADAVAVKAAKPADSDAKEKLICTRETLVGSTIPKRVCRSAEQIDQDRSKVQRAREDLRGADPAAPGVAGAN
jgi:hypothetical protein